MGILRQVFFLIVSVISILLLSGCGGNFYSIHHKDHLDQKKSTVIVTDAKQRFLLTNIAEKGANTTDQEAEMYRRFCAEPSPDVFTALGQAASGKFGFGQTSDPKNLEIAIQGAYSNSETASAIQRTQTINMLKEMMYRTCERFLNGQIGKWQYPIIAARDQRIMTSILAIEQLTGVVTPKPVVIASTGSASTGESNKEAIKILDGAKKNLEEQKSSLKKSQEEFGKVDKPEGSCKTLMEKKNEEITADDDKTKLKNCKDKKDKVAEAEKEVKSAKTYYDTIVNLAGKSDESSVTANAQLLASIEKTEIDKQIEQARTQAIGQVAETVKDIVRQSFDKEAETQFFCIGVFENKADLLKFPELYETCMDYLLKKVMIESFTLDSQLSSEYHSAQGKITQYKESSFDQFWNKIKDASGGVDKQKLEEVLDELSKEDLSKNVRDKLTEMGRKNTQDEINRIFKSLPIFVVTRLSE